MPLANTQKLSTELKATQRRISVLEEFLASDKISSSYGMGTGTKRSLDVYDELARLYSVSGKFNSIKLSSTALAATIRGSIFESLDLDATSQLTNFFEPFVLPRTNLNLLPNGILTIKKNIIQ